MDSLAPVPRPRSYRADNIKCILMLNVILFHSIIMLDFVKSPPVLAVLTFFRLSSMPAFCFLLGYYAKKTEKSAPGAVVDFLIPYLIFNTAYVMLYEKVPVYSISIPEFSYWFLLAAFTWKLISPALARIRYLVPLSIVCAVAIGFATEVDSAYTMQRIFSDLPFFAAGLMMNENTFTRLTKIPKAIIVPLALLVLGAAFFTLQKGWYDLDSLLHLGPYWWYYPTAVWKGALVRLLSYFGAGVFIVFYLTCVPDRKLSLVSGIGQRTMLPYLLHPYITDSFNRFIYNHEGLQVWYYTLPLAVAVSIAALLFLSLPVWDRAYKFCSRGLKKLLIRTEPAV